MMGISPQRYIVSMRLNAARNMLSAGKTDIEQIARRCGFADRYQFSKAFKKHYGIPPGKYREQLNEFILKPKWLVISKILQNTCNVFYKHIYLRHMDSTTVITICQRE